MRWVRDIAIVAGLAMVGFGATSVRHEQRSRDQLLQKASDERHRFEQMVKLKAASNGVELNQRGWPMTIDPDWFERLPPTNPMCDDDRPWVEVASSSESGLMNPPVRVLTEKKSASFWYNPYQGVVRARVPVMVSDDLTTLTYNQINATTLGSIFEVERAQASVKVESAQAPSKSDENAPASSASDTPGSASAKTKPAATTREPMFVHVRKNTPKQHSGGR